MKLLAILLFPLLSAGQCPPGQSFMPSISSNGVAIIADTCMNDADVKNAWAVYFKSICGEPTVTQFSTSYRLISGNTWVNDSIGCEDRKLYQKKISGVWVEISRCLFYWENKIRFKCYGGVDKNIEVSCCSHWHKTKPK